MGLDLTGSVVILDEAHNVEDTLRSAGSGEFGEFALCELIVMLNNYAITEKSTTNMMEVGGIASPSGDSAETAYLCDVAHVLLLFVEKIANKLRAAKQSFERNPGAKGADAVLREAEKFHSPDDTEYEVTFDGPSGNGLRGKPVGCLPFFEQLGLTSDDFEMLARYVEAFEKFFRGHEPNEASGERDRISNLVDGLIDLVHKMYAALKTPEHYYAAVMCKANGSLEHARCGVVDESEGNGGRSKHKPKLLPLIPPRTANHPNRPPNPCLHAYCKAQCTNILDPIRHGNGCDGSTPKWEATLHLNLLTPGPLMQQLSNECRTVVLASGSLSPLPSLCAELNLFPADASIGISSPKPTSTQVILQPTVQKRLQNRPPPLEADHVVDLDKQLFAVSIGAFADGSELRVAQKNYSQNSFLEKLGDAIVNIISGIPKGGVLIFLPSYSLLRRCERLWNPNGYRNNRRSFWSQQEESDGPSVFDRLKQLKHNVIVEPTGGQDEFEAKKDEYMESVKHFGGCVLFAVFRGKMSEGISFNDNNARGVICVGLPLPSAFSLPIQVKMKYNDEQRKLRHRTDLLPGREWYQQQAYR